MLGAQVATPSKDQGSKKAGSSMSGKYRGFNANTHFGNNTRLRTNSTQKTRSGVKNANGLYEAPNRDSSFNSGKKIQSRALPDLKAKARI